MSLQATLRCMLPAPAVDALLKATGRAMHFGGPYADWPSAAARSSGYDDATIVERVAAATREVAAGRAAFERDGVALDRPCMPIGVLSAILRHLVIHPGPLEVIDFGGSLGTLYRHCRPYLPPSTKVKWHVVEQASFVAVGRAEFTTEELDFHASLEELPVAAVPSLLLVSGSLQYLPRVDRQMDAFDDCGAATLLLDRLTISDRPDDLVGVQHVPAWIYTGSYPVRIFSRARLLERLALHWRLVGEHECPTDGGGRLGDVEFEYRGLLFERRVTSIGA